jgi:hypothetical protein
MKRNLNMAAMLAMASVFAQASYEIENPTPFEPNTKPKEPPRPKNHKKFIISGVEVWALSEKRARLKAKKLK